MDSNNRWLFACHEAGHGVVAIALGGKCLGMVMLPDDGGLVHLDVEGESHAIALAAGPAAEHLAELYPAPTAAPAELKQLSQGEALSLSVCSSSPELAGQMMRADRTSYDSDARKIALWAITGHENCPAFSWVRRVERVNRRAAETVHEHEAAIIRVAEALYVKGSLSEDEIHRHVNGEI